MPKRKVLPALPIQADQVRFSQNQDADLDFLVEDFIPAGYLILLAAAPKEGKSCLVTAIALAIASGTPFAGMKTNRASVLWLVLEESADERRIVLSQASDEILQALSKNLPLPPAPAAAKELPLPPAPAAANELPLPPAPVSANELPLPPAPAAANELPLPPAPEEEGGRGDGGSGSKAPEDLTPEHPTPEHPTPEHPASPALYQAFAADPIDTDEGIAELLRTADELKAKLIVIDPLHAATSGRSLYDGWLARKTLQRLKQMCNQSGITVIALHHVRERGRDPRPAESQQLSAAAGMYMVLEYRDWEGKPFGDGYMPWFPVETPEGLKPPENRELRNPGNAEEDCRAVTLICRGRGEFANRVFNFRSYGPLDYAITQSDHLIRKYGPPRTLSHVDRAILAALKTQQLTCAQLAERTGLTYKTIQNAVTRLYHRHELTVAKIKSGVRTLCLPKKRK